jgi:uncharacterized protein GlcG (DUF336 family)
MTVTFMRASVSQDLARAIIDAAERKSAELGEATAVAIVDDSGVLKAFGRMDGAPLMSVRSAQDKATSAASWGISTDSWRRDVIKDDLIRAMSVATSGITLQTGGYPITVGDAVVGAIGVSGSRERDHNKDIAQAGLAAVTS